MMDWTGPFVLTYLCVLSFPTFTLTSLAPSFVTDSYASFPLALSRLVSPIFDTPYAVLLPS